MLCTGKIHVGGDFVIVARVVLEGRFDSVGSVGVVDTARVGVGVEVGVVSVVVGAGVVGVAAATFVVMETVVWAAGDIVNADGRSVSVVTARSDGMWVETRRRGGR